MAGRQEHHCPVELIADSAVTGSSPVPAPISAARRADTSAYPLGRIAVNRQHEVFSSSIVKHSRPAGRVFSEFRAGDGWRCPDTEQSETAIPPNSSLRNTPAGAHRLAGFFRIHVGSNRCRLDTASLTSRQRGGRSPSAARLLINLSRFQSLRLLKALFLLQQRVAVMSSNLVRFGRPSASSTLIREIVRYGQKALAHELKISEPELSRKLSNQHGIKLEQLDVILSRLRLRIVPDNREPAPVIPLRRAA